MKHFSASQPAIVQFCRTFPIVSVLDIIKEATFVSPLSMNVKR